VRELPAPERPVIVYPGSQLEYGAAPMPWTEETACLPADPYGESKLRATELLLAASEAGECRVGVARIPIVYGPCQAPAMFIPELIAKAHAGLPFAMTEGRQRRRFSYAADAVSFLLEYGKSLKEGADLPPLLNAPASEPLSMREIAERVATLIGDEVRLEIGAIPMRDSEVLDQWPDDSLAIGLGFSCKTEIGDGLASTVDWYRENGWFMEGGA
jgi:nucleoside-diphosphate-sugar epimerase